jgi:N-formylglutamate amidohydrolase
MELVIFILAFLLATMNCFSGNAAAQNEFPLANLLVSAGTGDLPIIISAPHGGRQTIPGLPERRGIGVPQFSAQRDNNTAELTHLVLAKLHQQLGARPFGIVADFERKHVDANRAPEHAYESAGAKVFYDAYHRSLGAAAERVRQRWGHGFLIDIHGQTAEQEAIFRGTDNLKSVSRLVARHGIRALSGANSVLGYLHARGYQIRPNLNGHEREKHYTGGYTTQTYGSHRGTEIDVMQLELGANLRRKANLERTANDLAQAIVVFAREFLPLALNDAKAPLPRSLQTR